MASLVTKGNSLPSSEKKKSGIRKLLSPFTGGDSQKNKNINAKSAARAMRETAFVASDGEYDIGNRYRNPNVAHSAAGGSTSPPYLAKNQPHPTGGSSAQSDNETIYGIAKPNFNGNLKDLKNSAVGNSNYYQDWDGNRNDRRSSISSSISTTSEIPQSPSRAPTSGNDQQFPPPIPPYSQYYTTRNQNFSPALGRPPMRAAAAGKTTGIPQRRSQQQIEREMSRVGGNNNYETYADVTDNAPSPKTAVVTKPEIPNKPMQSAGTPRRNITRGERSPEDPDALGSNPIYNNLSALETSNSVYYCPNSNYFVRGSKQRNTTGSLHSPVKNAGNSKIPQHSPYIGETKLQHHQQNVAPIFKRGTLMACDDKDLAEATGIKKNVSFSTCSDSSVASESSDYWPTKNGLKPNPPTRKSTVSDSCDSVFFPASSPSRPLPPVPFRNSERQFPSKQPLQPVTENVKNMTNKWQNHSESESGSEAGEILYILQDDKSYPTSTKEEDWADGKGSSNADQTGSTNGRAEDVKRGSRSARREDPRRHTLSGDHQNYPQQLTRSMDLEAAVPRGYPPPSSAMMFDDDPGIMSEVETSSTGFRRGNKQRSSLPVVRTPSKTLERPLGLVFLQYRSETKRALLPNEITSIDTVKALFVRSFPKQLTMEYLDSPLVKIYIHDSSKDMFYELEDLRSHLRDIRDRSVLRLFESADVTGGVLPAGLTVAPPSWDQDQSYFSEPEFDSEYQHQHIHKTKGSKSTVGGHQPYYMTTSFPPGSSTLPRGGSLLRAYSPALPKSSSDRIHGGDPGYMSSPERGGTIPPRAYSGAYVPSAATQYEDPYYAQYSSRTGSITPVIDEETSDTELMDESYNLYGVKLPTGPVPARSPFPPPAQVVPPPYDTRIRVEHMERQLANLTGLVQKVMTQQTPTPAPRELPAHLPAHPGSFRSASEEYDKHSSSGPVTSMPDETYVRTDFKPPKLGKDKSVSFEKSVSFSDEPPDMNSPKQHSPQHGVDTKPTKSAIKSSTLPRMSSQERDRLKPAPPPKPVSISPGQYEGRNVYRDLQLTPEMYNQLRGFQKKVKDLKSEVRNLRRMSQAQAHTIRETIKDANIKIRAMLVNDSVWTVGSDTERLRISREEDLYKQEMIHLETDLTELEGTVEELRGNVINRKTRVNMSDVENMALILSKSSKTVADLKLRFPGLQDAMKSLLNQEMDKVVCEEKFLKEEPERLESALRRCKKLTGTLVTLKRLASVQEQRLPDTKLSPTLDETPPTTPTSSKTVGARNVVGPPATGSNGGDSGRPENALDALLDELQTFSKQPPPIQQQHSVTTLPSKNPTATLMRLHSYPTSETKPPVPERNVDLINKRVPPPPPPRTSSKSPLASPTSTVCPSSVVTTITNTSGKMSSGSPVHSLKRNTPLRSSLKKTDATLSEPMPVSNSSSCESVNSINSQEGSGVLSKSRQEELESRHQELLRKQKQLQEQYTRLQQLQRSGNSTSLTSPSQVAPDLLQLKKTGSESNLLHKLNLNLTISPNLSGSLSQLATTTQSNAVDAIETTDVEANANAVMTSSFTSTSTTSDVVNSSVIASSNPPTANKVYETDIL